MKTSAAVAVTVFLLSVMSGCSGSPRGECVQTVKLFDGGIDRPFANGAGCSGSGEFNCADLLDGGGDATLRSYCGPNP
jgi:hypothetical protein